MLREGNWGSMRNLPKRLWRIPEIPKDLRAHNRTGGNNKRVCIYPLITPIHEVPLPRRILNSVALEMQLADAMLVIKF